MSSAVATSAIAQTIKVNWHTNAPFVDYRTYAWRPTKHPGSGFYRQWVEKDVDAELAQKGLRRVEASQHPDLYIYYHMVEQEVMDSTAMDDGFGRAVVAGATGVAGEVWVVWVWIWSKPRRTLG